MLVTQYVWLIEDSYNLRTRLDPSVIVFLPIMLAVASWWPGEASAAAHPSVVGAMVVGSYRVGIAVLKPSVGTIHKAPPEA